VLERIQQAVGKECLPINLPAKNANRRSRLLFQSAGESDFFSVEAAHSALVDQVVEVDEKLMEKYL